MDFRRDQGRGRGFRGTYQSSRSSRPQQWTPPTPAPPFGRLIEELDVEDLASMANVDAKISATKTIASFNWLDGPTPEIAIPGKPPLWSPLNSTRQLREDDGTYYRDRNASNCPQHPMEATILSIMASTLEKASYDIDVLCCSSTLGNLLRTIRGEDRHFRMLVETVGDVVHLIRRENSPREIIPNVRGYGHSFPEAYTTWEADVRRSTSHQRVVSYSFGGLCFLTRFEADGYLGPGHCGNAEVSAPVPSPINPGTLEDLLSGAKIASPVKSSDAPVRIATVVEGTITPQSAIFDLKTRSMKRKEEDILGQELPRLWVAQIPNFVLAFHDRGVFQDIEVRNVEGEVRKWEEENVKALSLLAQLVRKIVHIARQAESGRFELCVSKPGKVEIRQQTSDVGPMLSAGTMERWKSWLGRQKQATEMTEQVLGGNDDLHSLLDWDNDDEKPQDFTACDAACGYCGRCTN